MKRILLTLLAIVVVVGLFAAFGFAGYRLGYVQGAQGAPTTAIGNTPQLRPFDDVNPRGMRDFGFERGFHRGFGMGSLPMRGFGFFALLMWLGRIVILGLVIWFIYWLFTRNGWRLTREPVSSPPAVNPPSNENE